MLCFYFKEKNYISSDKLYLERLKKLEPAWIFKKMYADTKLKSIFSLGYKKQNY